MVAMRRMDVNDMAAAGFYIGYQNDSLDDVHVGVNRLIKLNFKTELVQTGE